MGKLAPNFRPQSFFYTSSINHHTFHTEEGTAMYQPSLRLSLQAARVRRLVAQTTRSLTLTKEVRLNKFLSEIGVCSRRDADGLISSGRVKVDNQVAVLGTKVNVEVHPPSKHICVTPETSNNINELCGNYGSSRNSTSSGRFSTVRLKSREIIHVDGEVVQEKVKGNIYLALNKPIGIVCTTDTKREKNNIIDFINYPSKERLFHIGRLDKPSCGLILLTNDGDIVNKILRAEHNHDKEYIVEVNKPLTSFMIEGMMKGVPLVFEDGSTVVTNSCLVVQMTKTSFRIILTQGLNRQIRRMCQFFKYEVVSLKRVRIMHVQLGTLPVGHYRDLTAEEVETLHKST